MDHVNINLHNLSAEEALNELFLIYRKLTSTNTYKDILAIFVESLQKRVEHFEASIIVFLDKKNIDGAGEVIASTEIKDNTTLVIDLGKYPEIRAAVEKKDAFTIEDIATTSLIGDDVRALILGKGIHSTFVLPVFDINDIIGVVLVRSRDPIQLSSFLQRYYFIQANLLASAILNISRMRVLEESKNKAYELLKINEDYEFLFNHAMDGMMLIDREGKIRAVNKSFEKLTGYGAQEILGQSYSKAIANDTSRETANQIFQGYLKRQFVSKFEIEIKTKSGAFKTISIRATPLPGRQDVSLISLRDVTEEKLLSKELLKTTDLLLKTISSSSDAIIAVDTGGKLLFFNEESTRLFGYSRDEAIQYVNVTQLYPQNVAKEVMKLLRQSPTKHIRNYPIEVRTRGGETIPVTLSGAIVYNEKGEEQMSVGYLRDEREKIRMEKTLDEALSKLIEAEKNDAMTNLAGAAAHNLNQPLSAIQGYSELLIHRLKDRDQTTVDYASRIISEVEKMSGIIKQISRITKYEIKPYAGTAKIVDIGGKKSGE